MAVFVFHKTVAIWLLYQIYSIMWNILKQICKEYSMVLKLMLT